jgi:hypothetical protein
MLNFLIMKKQILNLGKALNKAEQKSINGGIGHPPTLGPCQYLTNCFSNLCILYDNGSEECAIT